MNDTKCSSTILCQFNIDDLTYKHGHDDRLKFVRPIALHIYSLYMNVPQNPQLKNDVPPKKKLVKSIC